MLYNLIRIISQTNLITRRERLFAYCYTILFSNKFGMENSEIFISGPEYTGTKLWGSIAEHLIPKMKSQPKDFISQVDYATNESVTSGEFLRNCIEVAEGLIKFGLKTGDVVSFICTNSIISITTALGIILSGGILSPMDVTLKTLELQHLFKQLQPKFIISENVKAKEIQKSLQAINLNAKIVLLDSSVSKNTLKALASGEFYCWNDIKTKVDVENYIPRKVTDPKKDIAIISCSSGSTGMPKGIALSHYAILLNSLMTDTSILPENPAILFTSPLYWVSGIFFTINSCYFGWTRYVPKSTGPEHTLEAIEKCKPFFIFSSPAALCFLVEHPNFKKYDVSSVKLICSAGAILGKDAACKIRSIWKGALVGNLYGLTETCGGIAMSLGTYDLNAVGKLLPEVKLKVADTVTGKSLGPHKIGECRIKSPTLMNYYYNNEEETKAAFDDNGWFRTGDLVYYDEEGLIFVVGRQKEAIAYQSYEISPAEIESFIIGLPGVKDVAVVPVPHDFDVNHLRALVVKGPNSYITAQDIIDGVKGSFTERKHLKAGVQFVDALPRSSVGKLKRSEAQKVISIPGIKVYYDGES